MAPGLRHLFIDCICPHHHIITSNHAPRQQRCRETGFTSRLVRSTAPKVTPRDLVTSGTAGAAHQPAFGRTCVRSAKWNAGVYVVERYPSDLGGCLQRSDACKHYCVRI